MMPSGSPPPAPQHPYGGAPYRPAPAPAYGARLTDTRAVLALVLGALSVACFGLLAGIPAILLGASARRAIERSGGALGGEAMAVGGIVLGALGSAVSALVAAAVAAAVVMAPAGGGEPAPVVPTSSVAPGVAHRATVGKVDVVQLASDDGALGEQLASELARARGANKVLLVETTASWCRACGEIDASLADARMQAALANVQIVRVDVDEFRGELMLQKMWEGSVPWFYKIDSTAHPLDAISADEWDENVPQNIAPVLKAFAAGTFTARRNDPAIGTPL